MAKKTVDEIIDEFYDRDKVDSFHLMINEEPTFYGVLHNDEVWQSIRKSWNDTTAKNYLSDYIKYAIPLGLNDKPLKDITKEDFEQLFIRIREKRRSEGKTYHEERMHQFAYRILAVTSEAYKAGICPDVLWGSQYQTAPDDECERVEAECVKLKKSLSIGEEIYVVDRILSDPKQKGEYFGLALMFCLGLRNNEAVAVTFSDIHCLEKDRYVLYIYKSSEKGTRNTKYSGKTRNASRIIPIPNRLLWLLRERRRFLCNELNISERQINNFTIACKGNDYDCQCKPAEIGALGTQLLREASVDGDMLMYIDKDLAKERELEPGVFEKDPTAYLFRRNLATHLYILGLSENEIQYIMGHNIEDVNDERSFFRNEEKLLMIAEKMEKRPIVNGKKNELSCDVECSHFHMKNITNASLRVNMNNEADELQIRVCQREPYSKTEIQFGDNIIGMYYSGVNDDAYDRAVNIIPVYQERYSSAEEKTIQQGD